MQSWNALMLSPYEVQDTDAVYARALDEVTCAMNILLGSAVRLAKAVNGPGGAPRVWWLSADWFLHGRSGNHERSSTSAR